MDKSVNLDSYILDAIEDLKARLPPNAFQTHQFEAFTELIGGLHCMQPMYGFLSLEANDALDFSESSIVKDTDEKVDCAHLSSYVTKPTEAEKVAVTDVFLNPASSTFRSSKQLNIAYLTHEQKDINDNAVNAIIEGPAGAGKTLLVQAKVLQLVQEGRGPILFVGPDPLYVRFKHFCMGNGLTVHHTDVLPASSSADVITMDIEKFAPYGDDKAFSDNCNVIISDEFHVFIDDFQVNKSTIDYACTP